MAKIDTLTPITSPYGSKQAINDNNTKIENALLNTLSLDGSSPNSMGADLDMDSNNILNVNEITVATLTIGSDSISDMDDLIGSIGPQGPQGIQGETGADSTVEGPEGPTGPQGPQGDPGVAGDNGLSAYEVAVADGFVGDETAWLASLVGPAGPAGADGADGATGPQGDPGATGAAGADGADGTGGSPILFWMI